MPSVTFAPVESDPFAPGDLITFILTTSADFPSTLGPTFDITYDSDLLSYEGLLVEDDDLFDFTIDRDEPDDASGIITLENLQAASFAVPSGENVVARLQFTVLAPGETSVEIGPHNGIFFLDGVGTPLEDIAAPAPFEFVINVPPTANDDSATTDEDNAVEIAVLDNDTDPGDTPTLDSFGQASNGTVTETANGLTYTPDDDFFGDDSFTYTIIDSEGLTDTATVNITVNSVNDPPEAGDDFEGLDKNTSIEIAVLDNDSDPEGDDLTITEYTDGANGTVSQDGDSLVYIPDADYVGDDSFTYTISDGNGGFDTATVNIIVNETNFDPVAVDDSANTNEDTLVEIAVLDNDEDPDEDELSIVDFTNPLHGSVELVGDVFEYTPDANFNGPDSFSYVVADGKGGEDVGQVTINIAAVNDGPVAEDDSSSVDQDGSVEIDVLANDSDIDGDALTVTLGDASNGTVSEEDGIVTYTPDAGYTGSDSFTYMISDGNGGTDEATVDISVNGIIFAPEEDRSYRPGETLQMTLTTSEEFADFVGIIAKLTYNADELEYLGFEANPQMDVFDVPEPVNPSGETTIFGIQGGSANPNFFFGGDTDVVTFNFNVLATGSTTVSIMGDQGFFFFGDGEPGQGPAPVFDGSAETLIELNSLPEAVDDFVTMDEDSSVDITADILSNDSDPDGDIISIIGVGEAANGTVSLVNGVVTYTADENFFGADSFEYTISDGGGEATATVNVTVNSINDAPVLGALASEFSYVEGDTAALFTATATDVEDSPLNFSLTGADAGLFNVNATSGEVTFKTVPEYQDGGDNEFEFNIVVSDGDLTDSQAITVSLLKDTDSDLVADIADNAIFAFNPDQRDTDGDGFGNIIDGDLDGDLDIDIFDLLFFRNDFGASEIQDEIDTAAHSDFNGDGSVDILDLARFKAIFGDTLGPEDSAFYDAPLVG